MELVRRLDPSQIQPLRRAPLCHRTKVATWSWSLRARLALQLAISLLLLAGVSWAGAL